ncbi:MAG: alcohol dehydrogenase catalytic domain-containing protein [Vicinamibacterales bacterium]|jgi:alcohol dehydrogenase|nr:alcohol dehydrogenase catalytic domain-containing protein [Vicinamibacterales bacterium]
MKSVVIGRSESDPRSGAHVEHRDIETRAGECRVAIRLAGICGTDLQILEGYAGFSGVPGHEFVGMVETAPDGDRHWIGKRVVGEINVGCGNCDWCRADTANHCPTRTVLGIVGRAGAFASHLSLPAANFHTVPDTLDDEAAVLVEPTAAACQILTQVDIGPRATVAVVGDGRMALLVGQVLRTTGAEVTLFGKHDRKLQVARQLGLDARRSTDDTPASSFDVSVDVTGRPAGLTRAMELVRPRGTVVMKSTFHGETPMTLWPVIVDEVTLVGSRCGPFADAIALLAGGKVHTRPLLAGTYPLEDFGAAFDTARSKLKVLLRP